MEKKKERKGAVDIEASSALLMLEKPVKSNYTVF